MGGRSGQSIGGGGGGGGATASGNTSGPPASPQTANLNTSVDADFDTDTSSGITREQLAQVTVQDIYKTLSSLNGNASYTDQRMSDQNRDFIFRLAQENVEEGTLAYNILYDTRGRYSDRQLWAMSYALDKKEGFKREVYGLVTRDRIESEQSRQRQKDKLSSNKEASSGILATVKLSGKNLKDYYSFVKGNRKYAREFYSKKFTAESVAAFLNQ
jgi:hypothetical protein